MTNTLHVGVARCDITPPLGTPLAGYPDPDGKRAADSVRDPLHATALAFQCAGERAAIVSVDVTIIEDMHIARVRAEAAERTGIDPKHITISAIQTHSAPCTQRAWGWCEVNEDYVERLMIPGIVDAIAQAAQTMKPARMGIATVQSEVGINRRRITDEHGVVLGVNHWAVYDPTMTVLRFETSEGTLANLVHYGAHPTVLGSWSKAISRDWPGVMVDRMEQLTGATTLYFNGAVGDIAPRTNHMRATGDSEAALMEAGYAAAMDAMKAWRSIKDMRAVELHVEAQTFDLPYRPLPPLGDAQRELKAAEGEKDQPGQGMALHKYWKAVVGAHAAPTRTGKPFDQVITALGPIALVPIPGEPFGETVMRLRDVSPFQHTLALSTSCGNNGYFPTRESLHRGGYEVWINRALGEYLFVDAIDDVLVERNLALLKAAYPKVYPQVGL